MSLVQTFSKCLKYNLETKKEINHFTVMGEDKDLNLGLQEIPAKAAVWIRCDSSVGGRGCAVRSAQTLLVILIPVLGKAWAVRSANWPPSQREHHIPGQHLGAWESKELPWRPRHKVPYSQTDFTNPSCWKTLQHSCHYYFQTGLLRFSKCRSHRDNILHLYLLHSLKH